MRGALVEALEDPAGMLGHVGDLVVVAHERPDRIEVVEPHDGGELDDPFDLAAHEVDRAKPGDPLRLDPGDDLAPHDGLVLRSVLGGGPPTPDATDHDPILKRVRSRNAASPPHNNAEFRAKCLQSVLLCKT